MIFGKQVLAWILTQDGALKNLVFSKSILNE